MGHRCPLTRTDKELRVSVFVGVVQVVKAFHYLPLPKLRTTRIAVKIVNIIQVYSPKVK